jgi:hypothetical protein
LFKTTEYEIKINVLDFDAGPLHSSIKRKDIVTDFIFEHGSVQERLELTKSN